MNGRKGKNRRWNGEEAECREDEEGREGKGEGELKGLGMRAWAWVQTGRVSLRSFGIRSRRCRNVREKDGDREQTECEANEKRGRG